MIWIWYRDDWLKERAYVLVFQVGVRLGHFKVYLVGPQPGELLLSLVRSSPSLACNFLWSLPKIFQATFISPLLNPDSRNSYQNLSAQVFSLGQKVFGAKPRSLQAILWMDGPEVSAF